MELLRLIILAVDVLYVRAKTILKLMKNPAKNAIIVTELPYQVNKARLVERIAELVKEKKIEGITALA